MPSSSHALQHAIFSALSANTQLTTVLGAARIYDQVPQPAEYPYVTFGQSSVRDADVALSAGDEHVVTLHVWSRARGRAETHAVIDQLRAALHDQSLSLIGHRLINLRHDFSEARRDPDGETIHGIVRLRAVTEPI
jgi:Protein of unknown function (DUF3168)